MSKITITIKTSIVEITQRFDSKKLGTHERVLVAALKWLTNGTPYTFIKRL